MTIQSRATSHLRFFGIYSRLLMHASCCSQLIAGPVSASNGTNVLWSQYSVPSVVEYKSRSQLITLKGHELQLACASQRSGRYRKVGGHNSENIFVTGWARLCVIMRFLHKIGLHRKRAQNVPNAILSNICYCYFPVFDLLAFMPVVPFILLFDVYHISKI